MSPPSRWPNKTSHDYEDRGDPPIRRPDLSDRTAFPYGQRRAGTASGEAHATAATSLTELDR